MKKSNYFLIGTFVFALSWIIIYNFLIASVVKTIPGNARSIYGHLSHDEVVMQLQPFNKIKFDIQGSPQIYFTQSDSSEISISDGYSKYLKIVNRNGTLSITITAPQEDIYEIIHLKIPKINDILICQSPPEVVNESALMVFLENIKSPKLNLDVSYPEKVEFVNCDISSLVVNGNLCAGNYPSQGIRLDASNQIDSLLIHVGGMGKVSLSKAGVMYNSVTLSDSIQIEATMPVMKRILGK